MGAQRIMYQIVGCYQRGREVIGYHLQSSDGKSGPYTREQIFYLTGRGQITNCSAQVYFDKTKNWTDGKVLLRGVGTSLDSLPVKKLDSIPGAAVQGQATAPIIPPAPIQKQAQPVQKQAQPVQKQAQPVQKQAQPTGSRNEIVNKLAKPWINSINHTIKAIPEIVKSQYETRSIGIFGQCSPGYTSSALRYLEKKPGDDILEATVAKTRGKSRLVLVLTQINKDGSFVARAELKGGWHNKKIKPERINGESILLCEPRQIKNQEEMDWLIGTALDVTGFICDEEYEWFYSQRPEAGPYKTSKAWDAYRSSDLSALYEEFSDIVMFK